jgi:hypothetical protein
MHDYFSGMICLRDGGTQMPEMIKKYTNKGVFWIYEVFCVPAAAAGGRRVRLYPGRHCRHLRYSASTASLPPSPPGSSTV